MTATTEARADRRAPVQARSRQRVAALLDAAERVVERDGVEAATTKAIAAEADMPVASLYQYFADRDAVLVTLLERHAAEMDAEVAAALAALDELDVQGAVDAVLDGFVAVYRRRPAFVVLYLRGRGNAAVSAFGRAHNREIARALLAFAREAAVVSPELGLTAVELLVEVGDRVFQLAFEHSDVGDPEVLREGRALLSAYLGTHAVRT